MSISIEVEAMQDMGRKFETIFKEEVKKADMDISKKLVSYAKNNHRFRTKSGRLESAIKIKGNLFTNLEVFIDLRVADYARYVVGGQRSWRPDEFLSEALADNEAWINQRISRAVSISVTRFNRLA